MQENTMYFDEVQDATDIAGRAKELVGIIFILV
jgi:hypothetical protein